MSCPSVTYLLEAATE